MHRSTHIEKLPKLSVAIPGESNAFQVREYYQSSSEAREHFPGGLGDIFLHFQPHQNPCMKYVFPSHFLLVDFALPLIIFLKATKWKALAPK